MRHINANKQTQPNNKTDYTKYFRDVLALETNKASLVVITNRSTQMIFSGTKINGLLMTDWSGTHLTIFKTTAFSKVSEVIEERKMQFSKLNFYKEIYFLLTYFSSLQERHQGLLLKILNGSLYRYVTHFKAIVKTNISTQTRAVDRSRLIRKINIKYQPRKRVVF